MVLTRRQKQQEEVNEADVIEEPQGSSEEDREEDGAEPVLVRTGVQEEKPVLVPGQPPFRPIAAPAGAWPPMPWWHSALCDPYERFNTLSHGIPGLIFLACAPFVYRGALPGGLPLALFCVAAAITHLSSAASHIWPDSIGLEKFDHFAIIALIAGTPLTALMAVGQDIRGVLVIMGVLLIAAAMPKAIRTVCFVVGGATLATLYASYIFNVNLLAQLIMYLSGAIFFLRNKGDDLGHVGLHDHHFLHYFSTMASLFHVWYLLDHHHGTGIAAGLKCGR